MMTANTAVPLSERIYRPIVEKILSWLKGTDRIDYADLLIEHITRVEMTLMSDGEINVKPYSAKAMMVIRLVKGKKHLETSLGISDNINVIISSLSPVLDLLEKIDEDPGFGLVEIPNNNTRYGLIPQIDIRGHDFQPYMQKLLEFIKEEKEFLEKDGYKCNPEAWFFSEVEEKFIADTTGIYKTQILPITFLQIISRTKKNEKTTRIRTRIGDIASLDLLFDSDCSLNEKTKQKIRDGFKKSKDLHNARALTTEEVQKLSHYVLSPSTMVFVHEAEGHNFEADLIFAGSSGIYSKEGIARNENFAAPCVNILDGPVNDQNGALLGFGSQFIDDEGIEVQTATLIKNGELTKEFLNSREMAYRFDQKPNGHAFSELGSIRIPRMTNTYIAAASSEYKTNTIGELVSDIGFGVILYGSMGGQVSKEGMSTSIQYGYIIKNGKISEEMLLPGNLSVLTDGSLATIEKFFGDIEISEPGFCGKGQHKYVTDGGPFVKIKKSEAICITF